MSRTNTIILVAILLIFLYWMNKRGKLGSACAGLWDKMHNRKAEQVFFEKMVEIDNDPDLKANITANTKFGYDYGKCVYTAEWMSQVIVGVGGKSIPAPHQLLSLVEISKVKNCICDKFKIQ